MIELLAKGSMMIYTCFFIYSYIYTFVDVCPSCLLDSSMSVAGSSSFWVSGGPAESCRSPCWAWSIAMSSRPQPFGGLQMATGCVSWGFARCNFHQVPIFPIWALQGPFCGFDFEIDCGTWMHGGYELLLVFHVQTILPFDVHCQTSGTT